jgi:membrane fusion protein
MTDLFRPEVMANRPERLFGEVVINQPVSTRYLVAALAGTMLIAATWVTLGRYARVETAQGVLVTDKAAPKVMAAAPGIVSEMLVKEGTIVAAGDRLAVIQLDRQTEAGSGAAAASLSTIDARRSLGGDQMQFSAARLESERARLFSAISAAEAQAGDMAREITLQSQIIASNKSMFDQLGKVVERGFVSQFEYERRRQTYLGSQQQLASLVQQRRAQLAQADQSRAQLASLASQSAGEQADLRASMQSLEQQRAGLEGQKSYVITAPVAGRVTAVQTNVGTTTTPNSPLMSIVPVDAQLKAEIYAPSRAIGLVRAGQETRMLYDAFPYQRFGSFTGRIASVSRVIIDPRETAIPVKLEEPVYKVTVTLNQQNVQAFGEMYALQPGMALTANIVLERQSFLDWLLTPLRAVTKRT